MGPMYLSAVLKQAGHQCRAFVLPSAGGLGALRAFAPHVVGLSAMSVERDWALKVVRSVRALLGPATRIILGGKLPTFEPDLISGGHGLDAICVGEGEAALLEYAAALERGEPAADIRNIWVLGPHGTVHRNDPRPALEELDTLPFPDRDLYNDHWLISRLRMTYVWIARGCSFDCSFCFHHAYRKIVACRRRVRLRDIDRIMEELHQLARDRPDAMVWLGADNFFSHGRWSLELLERYRQEIDLPFALATRIEQVTDERARAIAAAGRCLWVSFGLESGDEQVRREVLRRQVSDEQIRDGVANLRRHGLPVSTTNMMGFPGERLDQALRTIRFNAEIRPNVTVCSIFLPLPGTDLGEVAASGDGHSMFGYGSSPLKGGEIRHIERLHKFFFIGAHVPRTIPLLQTLARIPFPPQLGVPIFLASYFLFTKLPQMDGTLQGLTVTLGGVLDQVSKMDPGGLIQRLRERIH